jgi:hypothetical protein
LLLIALAGCMRPPGAKLVGIKSKCNTPFNITITYTTGPGQKAQATSDFPLTLRQYGEVDDEIVGDHCITLTATVTGAINQKRTWTETEIPSELKTPKLNDGDAVLEIYPDQMVLRNWTKWEKLNNSGVIQLSAAGLCCLLIPILILFLSLKTRSARHGTTMKP